MCLGAANSRVIRICVSVGRVTVAVPLVVIAIVFLLLHEVFQHDIQLVEPLRPRALVLLDPIVNGLERVAVEPIEPLAPALAYVDSSAFPAHTQVLRDLRLSESELYDEIIHWTLAAREGVQDLPSPWLGHGVECV